MGITLNLVLAAFGGGAFGAALGALPAFIFCGFAVMAGEALALATGGGVITGSIGFGALFGPHIALPVALRQQPMLVKKGNLMMVRTFWLHFMELMKIGIFYSLVVFLVF